MARHNREGQGTDQRGYEYVVSYQPDWLQWIKVTRALESGRQSTKMLFRNPTSREQEPGPKTRTGIRSAEQNLDFEIVVNDPGRVVKRVIVEVDSQADSGPVSFTIENDNPPPNGD